MDISHPAVGENVDERNPENARKFVFYRYFDKMGALLYAGRTNHIFNRNAGHLHAAPWAREIATITLEWFDSQHDARLAAHEAIRAENPRYRLKRQTMICSVCGGVKVMQTKRADPRPLCITCRNAYSRKRWNEFMDQIATAEGRPRRPRGRPRKSS
jgi:hypothetical protein